jgi:hypothetical protein
MMKRNYSVVAKTFKALVNKSYLAGTFGMRTLRALAIKSCLAGRFDEDSVLLLTSSPRSGSTWLGNALGLVPNSCVLFEPLHLTHVPEANAAGFSWRTFVHPENNWPEGEKYLRRVFEGRVINGWTSREMSLREAYGATTMIIKFVRSNRLLPWICRTFKVRSPILLIRHPCAVIASQLKSSDWRTAGRPDVTPYLADCPFFQSVLSKTEGVEENLAAGWALDQLPALMQQPPHPWTIITYEELVLRPKSALTRIFNAWELDVDMDAAVARLRKPSSVVYKSGISGIDGWKKQLNDKQVSRILSTIRNFGLGFYTHNVEPDYDELYSDRLAGHIRNAGMGKT